MPSLTVQDIRDLAEDVELEAKKAVGKYGRGELPTSFFETYSAMANTNGGIVLLGVEEKPEGVYAVLGIRDVGKVCQDLWNALHNRQRISANLLKDEDVEIIAIEGKQVIKVSVPRGTRRQRPVFVGSNPFFGSYQRRNEGDFKCDEESVKRMLAEQIEDARDSRVLPKFGLDDLHRETFATYRNVFKASKPDHPWNEYGEIEFMRMIGGWRHDRDANEQGLTLAGLLMFGKLRSILDVVPHYVVDYQERPEPKAEPRWVDRVTTDGMWSGNLYDFYRLVMRKVTTDLKVPFRLRGDQRQDDTPIHEALREALVNTLIHADYTGRISVLVVKRPDMFGFRNPGTMRIPADVALKGGESDCRNRNLQKMFQLVGLGEQAGSGLPKIYRNWVGQSWRWPLLYENYEREQTLLELRMVSLLPEEVVQELDRRFGERFRCLPEVERLALATAAVEGLVTHSRLRDITTSHPHDLTRSLASLVRDGFLESGGTGRGTFYVLPGERSLIGEDPFNNGIVRDVSERVLRDLTGERSEHYGRSSEQYTERSEHLGPSSEQYARLLEISVKIKLTKRAPKKRIERVILEACRESALSLRELSQLLGREAVTVRTHYLAHLIAEKRLELTYPDRPNHPRQRYRTTSQGSMSLTGPRGDTSSRS